MATRSNPTLRRLSTCGPSMMALMHSVAEQHFTSLDMVCSRDKAQPIITARHACWVHMRRVGYSTTQIGKLWGYDHSTIVVATNKLMRRAS